MPDINGSYTFSIYARMDLNNCGFVTDTLTLDLTTLPGNEFFASVPLAPDASAAWTRLVGVVVINTALLDSVINVLIRCACSLGLTDILFGAQLQLGPLTAYTEGPANLLLYPSQFDLWTPSQCIVTPDTTINPVNGQMTADTAAFKSTDGTNSLSSMTADLLTSGASQGSYTFSTCGTPEVDHDCYYIGKPR